MLSIFSTSNSNIPESSLTKQTECYDLLLPVIVKVKTKFTLGSIYSKKYYSITEQ